MPRRAFIVFSTLLTLVLGASCSKAPRPNPAQARLVVLSPALAVSLADLGLRDSIVGRHAYDLVLDKSVPVCGDQSGIDYEALVRARPTDVLIEWGSRPLPERLTELAAQHAWQVRNFTLLTLDDVRRSGRELMAAYVSPGNESRSAECARLIAQVDAAFARRPTDLAKAGRTLLLLSATPPAALGPGSFHHQILKAIGGTPALGTGSPYVELDAEDVRALAPDGIVFIVPRPPGAPAAPPLDNEEKRELLGPLNKVDLPCVARGRVVVLDDPYALLPSTAMARFADDLADVLERWAAEPPPER